MQNYPYMRAICSPRYFVVLEGVQDSSACSANHTLPLYYPNTPSVSGFCAQIFLSLRVAIFQPDPVRANVSS